MFSYFSGGYNFPVPSALFHPHKPTPAETGLAARVDELRATVRTLAPAQIAAHAEVEYRPETDTFHLALFGSPITLSSPELIATGPNGSPLPDFIQALLFYYLTTSDGTPLIRTWVSFADLPGGRMYAQAFQGYSGAELIKAFDPDLDRFRCACAAAGGHPSTFGDASFAFLALPRVPLLVNYWLGDEDFPSTCQILFDAAATHSLPIDACAILGGMLAGRIVKAGGKL